MAIFVKGVILKTYIGTKIIQAEPMDEVKFLRMFKDQKCQGQETQPGYRVLEPTGGDTWLPKGAFEGAYREITEEEKTLLL